MNADLHRLQTGRKQAKPASHQARACVHSPVYFAFSSICANLRKSAAKSLLSIARPLLFLPSGDRSSLLKSFSFSSASLRLCAILFFCAVLALSASAASPVPANKPAAYPAWWFERDVISRLDPANANPTWSSSYSPSSDFVAVNQGQIKNLATHAYEELNARLPGGAGPNLTALYNSLQANTTGNFDAANLGQLKNVAKPFFDRLIEVGYTTAYPWAGSTTPSSDFAMVNIGQVKNLFSFDLSSPVGQIPTWWQNYYFPGQTGLNLSGLTPNGSNLTLLQCYQQGIDPRQPLSVSVSATGPYQAPANVVLVAGVNHPLSTTITRVDFCQGSVVLGSATQAPYQFTLNNAAAGSYTISAVAYAATGQTASATTQFNVVTSNRYNRGWGTDQRLLSSIVAVDFEKGTPLDGITNFTTVYPTSKYPVYPWFLRTQAEAGEPWSHIVTLSNAQSTFAPFNSAPLANGSTGTATGGTPPMVAFGSQGGGSSLFVNQSYNFGVAAGGQDANALTNPDIKIEVYRKSDFAGAATKVAPIYTTTFTLPRQANATVWNAFVQNGYVQDYHIVQSVTGGTVDFDTRVQYLTGISVTDNWGQAVAYPLLVTHKASNSSFCYKVSYMGITVSSDGTKYKQMGLDSALASQTYNVSYSLDFDDVSPWQAAFINQPQFQGTPLPSAYQGKSVDELIHNAPAVSDTLPAPAATGLNLASVDNSPELRRHPVLDKFVADMGNEPMGLVNYVLNEIELTDAVGYNTAASGVTDQSINPQGVARDALATFLEGQGSPAEQCALTIYLLRQAGYPCAYVFPQQNGTLMFDEQLSKLLRMQLRGAAGPSGTSNVPELIPVNYPWVAAYINGKWIHLFPWLKDTAVEEGADLWNYMPVGYQTGGQWLKQYLLNDPTIRSLSTEDNPGTLFPLYVQKQLANTGVAIDQVGMNIYNRRNYYTSWQDFPRPWTTPAVTNSNLAQSLDVAQNPANLVPALQNIFDTLSIRVISDRNNNGGLDAGEPVVSTGTMRMADIHDRRLLLYHQVTAATGTNAPKYNLILSLEAFSPAHTGNNTFSSGSSPDPGDLLNRQVQSVALQTTTGADNDDTLLYQLTYNRHRQAQVIPNLNSMDHWTPFLGVSETNINDSLTDTRYLRKGDMACLNLDYGRVSPKMQEFQAEKYWSYQQTVAANQTTTDPELANGQLLYVMGQSYYFKVSQFQQNVEDWTKTHAISWVAHGLSKLSPLRNADGTPNILNGDINLRYPRVDMAFQRAAWVSNGTSHPNSGDQGSLAGNSAAQLMIAETSTDEHRVINQFFQQSAAISTVKLLDIAQGWNSTNGSASHPGTGQVVLTAANYLAQGAVTYTANKTTGGGSATHSLADWAGGTSSAGTLWSQVVSALTDPNYGSMTTVYITPGPVTATGQQGQAYTGIGAFVVGVGSYGAFISDNMVVNNGGYGGDVGFSFYSFNPPAPQVISSFLTPTYDGGYTYQNYETPTVSSPVYTPPSYSDSNFETIYNGVSAGTQYVPPDQVSSVSVWNQQTSGTSVNFSSSGSTVANADMMMYDTGNIGTTSFYGGSGLFASGTVSNSAPAAVPLGGAVQWLVDPVNAITGEFYVDAVDLKLSGPMPLEIRRTYGSRNQADNSFGYGWHMSYFPYLMLSTDGVTSGSVVTTAPTLIYAAETDGSVIAYRKQTSPATRWVPTPADNPTMANAANGSVGGVNNPFNNRIDQTTDADGTSTDFILTGADGSVRTFKVQSFPTGSGATALTKTRPYLKTWKDNRGNSYSFTFGSTPTSPDYGEVNRIQSSNGDFVGFNYDTYGHIIEAYTGDGRRLYYQYDSFGDLTQVTLPDASTIGYTYQHATTPATAGAPAPAPYSTHLITQETKPGGRILQNVYDSGTYDTAHAIYNRRVVKQSATVGTTQTLVQNATFSYGTPVLNADGVTYNGSTTITDVNGNTTTYSYVGNQITNVNSPPQNNGGPRQNITQQWFTSSSDPGYFPRSLKTIVDKRGLTTNYQYDSKGNLIQLSQVGNLTGSGSNTETATSTMAYNSASEVALPGGTSTIPNTIASVTDPVGRKTAYTYGDSQHPFSPTRIDKYASGTMTNSVQLQYTDMTGSSASAFGLLQSQNADQAVVTFAYNNNGFPISKTEATGTGDPNVVTKFAYNLRGELVSQTDGAGRSTKYTYDARGHRTAASRYDEWGNLVSWNFVYYNQNGEVEWEQGPRFSPNDYVCKQYDGAGRLTQEVKWLSAALSDGSGVTAGGYSTNLYKYDTFGNLIEVDNPNQNATKMTYDAIGEMLTRSFCSGAGAAAATESFTYEAGGQPATHTDVLGGVETCTYTYTGKLISDSLPNGTTKSYRYDLAGRVVRETLANGSYWTTAYNDIGRTVTRTFSNSGGTQLAQESQTFDPHGNVISKTDLGGNTFSSTYDALNRVKTASGPPAAGSTAQQTSSHTYDAAGQVHTSTNGAGERTLTYTDALGRPTLVSVSNSDGTSASNTGYWYSPDHQSVVTTVGTGSNAVKTTTFTDTMGHAVLVKHSDGTYQATGYDPNGNKIVFQDEQGVQTGWTYDALNHLVSEILPASGTTTTYTTNPAGQVLTTAMPGALTAKSVYDTAGRKTSEQLVGSDGSITRNYSYTYYGSGANKGLLQSVADPRGFSFTTTYDDWMRPSTVNSSGAAIAQQNQNTTYGYDPRGLLTSVAQSYATGATGPATLVTRGYDPYGQMKAETVSVAGTTVSQWAQSWDNAGRRSALNFQLAAQGAGAGSQYGFSHNAIGQLTNVANTGVNYSYNYADNGLLNQRTTPMYTESITRDGRGRILTRNDGYLLSETMTYRADSRLASYNASGSNVQNETRNYANAYDSRQRVVTEPFLQNSSPNTTLLPLGNQTNTFQFDGNTQAGLGVRTIQWVNGSTSDQVIAQDKFQRPIADYYFNGDGSALPWVPAYDPAGNTIKKSIVSGGTTYDVQTFTWDAWGRLVKMSQRYFGPLDFDWTTVYDGLGRRVQTTRQPMSSGVNTGASSYLNYYYDPQVEFLELGINNNGARAWRVYGPDKSGTYGGAQGVGGIESFVDENSGFVAGQTNNFFGDTVGLMSWWNGRVGILLSQPYGLTLGGYGPASGTGLYSTINGYPMPQWRGRYADMTGLIYMGARYYEPRAGRFLSCDPLGHSASMSLYDYCNGDPVNGLDPDGRLGKKAVAAGYFTFSAFLGPPTAQWVGMSDASDLGGWTDTSKMSTQERLELNTNYSNLAASAQEVVFAVSGAYQAPPQVRAPEPAYQSYVEDPIRWMQIQTAAKTGNLVQAEFDFVNSLPAKPPINWPPNRGFLGTPTTNTLQPGALIDRFGYEGGTFVSPKGTPYIQRSLAPGTQYKPYNVYEVVKPFDVQTGQVAPAFDMPGMGIQHELPSSVKSLLESGHIRLVPSG